GGDAGIVRDLRLPCAGLFRRALRAWAVGLDGWGNAVLRRLRVGFDHAGRSVVKESLRQSMASLHTCAGRLFGWLLFVMVASGTAGYCQEEITRWTQPEAVGHAAPEQATQAAVKWLTEKAPDAKTWFITPPGNRSA